jgi:hypothetical protein
MYQEEQSIVKYDTHLFFTLFIIVNNTREKKDICEYIYAIIRE